MGKFSHQACTISADLFACITIYACFLYVNFFYRRRNIPVKNNAFAFVVSLIVLTGFPTIFFLVSLIIGQWNFLWWSIPPSFLAGFTGLIFTLNQGKKG